MQEQFDENGLYDIYTVWHQPFWKTQTFFLIVGVIALSLIIAMMWFLFKRFFKRAVVTRALWVVVLEKLKKIMERPLESKEQGKQAYFDITELLKQYVSALYGFQLQGKTDEEVVQFLEKQNVPIVVKETIRRMGEGSLLIKFANQHAMRGQVQSDIEAAMQMIEKTIPHEKKRDKK